ncbi:hypothetical protein DFH06DRAFT_1339020 [Mycena polygramma]|nr:hypothetical protein DFH06DRAFT_1339020 [Mycena polygramma]
MPYKDAKLSIYFETQEMMELHVRATQGRLMCHLCIRHKKVFAHEHTLYAPNTHHPPLHLPSMLGHQRSPNKAAGAAMGKDIDGGV